MIELPQDFDSIFRYIVVVSQRAEQLIKGAKPRSKSECAKLTLIARDDVDQGLVPWRILSQEELDARRQEIVDQYRAEVGGDEIDEVAGESIPDVLPTGAAPEPEVPDDRDNELARLQKLLGMAGLPAPNIENDNEHEEAPVDEDEILVSASDVIEEEEAGAKDLDEAE
jgi:DNA-directed RNA polymerase subunit K/omega